MEDQKKVIKMGATITVSELAENLNTPVTSLIQELFKNGIVATINQKLDYDTVLIIIEELGHKNVIIKQADQIEELTEKRHQISQDATVRPPVVAVMGHVDHGKTTLLDNILGTKTVDDESGGITQHISAYQTKFEDKIITLLDTPGHEAFAAIRQHGALLTDIVVIVVAADDGVKPQTIEAIKFAKTANAKIIVAISKMDKPSANPEMVKGQLASEHNLNPEEWGGDTIYIPVSGKTGEGIDDLLSAINLIAEVEDYRADYDANSEGLVIEAKTEIGRGAVVKMLVEHGELAVGDYLVAGETYARIRTIHDFKGNQIKKAGPSTPVTLTGFKSLPDFGQFCKEVQTEKEARQMADENRRLSDKNLPSSNVTGLELLNKIHKSNTAKKFNVIVKSDVQGSLTSVVDNIKMIDTEDAIDTNIVSQSVGDITENDVKMAADDSTIIYGFNVNLTSSIKRMAARMGVKIRIYKVIYELLDDCKTEMEQLLEPDVKDTEIGQLKVKGVFKITKDKAVVGGLVTKGKLVADLLVRVKRGKEQIAEAKLTSIQKNKQDVKELVEGDMCGMSLETKGKVNIKVDDKLEFFKREFIAKKLK